MDKYREYTNGAITIRGSILDMLIQIEGHIDDYIAVHFCGLFGKPDQLKELILSTEKISMDAKRQVYISIIANNDSEFKKTHKSFDTTFQSVVRERNIFAHARLDKSKESIAKGGLTFIRYKNGKEEKLHYDADKVEKLREDFVYLIEVMAKIQYQLFQDQSASVEG